MCNSCHHCFEAFEAQIITKAYVMQDINKQNTTKPLWRTWLMCAAGNVSWFSHIFPALAQDPDLCTLHCSFFSRKDVLNAAFVQ